MDQANDTIPITDVNQFAALVAHWHSRRVKSVEHFLQLPEDADPPVEMQVGDGESIKLTGDILVGLKAGIQLALMELGTLPFAAEVEEDAPQGAAKATGG